jgi:hypothetical protein
MRNFNAPRPRPRFRWLLGLLFSGLPRRCIAGRFRDLAPSCADDPFAQPVGQAHPCQGRRFTHQGVVLRQESDSHRCGMRSLFFFPRSRHSGEL